VVGDLGLHVMGRFHVQKGFFSARGVTIEEGLTDPDQYGVDFKKQMVERSREVIAVIDSSKWNQVAFATYATIDQIDHLITDGDVSDALVAAFQDRGVFVDVV
jgi:DeoR/GlpR family transcriptional regulator of sugar metabolism